MFTKDITVMCDAKTDAEAAKAAVLGLTDDLKELYAALYDLYMDTADDISPIAGAMFKDSIAALLECFGILENAGVDYSAWLCEHFAPLAGELLASILGNSEELLDVAVPVFQALLEKIMKSLEEFAGDVLEELENQILYEYDRKLMEKEAEASPEADNVEQPLEDPDEEEYLPDGHFVHDELPADEY